MQRQVPNFTTLLVFEAAARTLNFTRAARRLNIQQPSVSRRVAELEAWLGAPLFRRDGSQLSLTPAGAELCRHLPKALDDIENVLGRLRNQDQPKRILIDISITFGSLWLMPRFSRLQAAFPETTIQMVSRHQNEAGTHAATDIVVYFRDSAQTYPGQQRLTQERLRAVCTPRYLAEHRAPNRADFTDTHRLLVLDEASHLDDWQRFLGRQELRLDQMGNVSFFSNFVVYLNAVLAGQGVGLAWVDLIEDHLASGALVPALPELFESDRGYFGFVSSKGHHDDTAQSVLAWLVEEAKTTGSL